MIGQATALTRLGTVRHRGARELRNHALQFATGLASVRRRLADEVEETTINYHLSAIVADDGHHHRGTIRAGDAAPEVTMEDGRSLHAVLAERTGHTMLHVGDEEPSFDALLVPPGGAVAERYGLVPGRDGGDPARRLRGAGGVEGRRAGAGAVQGGRAAGLIATAGPRRRDSATPRRLNAGATSSTAVRTAAIWPSRSGPRTTSWARSLPWRRNSGTGPSTDAPGGASRSRSAVAASCSGPGSAHEQTMRIRWPYGG